MPILRISLHSITSILRITVWQRQVQEPGISMTVSKNICLYVNIDHDLYFIDVSIPDLCTLTYFICIIKRIGWHVH